MGGGKDKEATNRMLNEDRSRSLREHQGYLDITRRGIEDSQGRANDMYKSMFGGYNDFIGGSGDFKPGSYVTSGGGGGGGGGEDGRFGEAENSYRNFLNNGGVDQGRFSAFQGHLMDIAGNGGWSDEARKNVMGDVTNLRDTANSADVANRFRGGGVFDEFARTGGYSDADISNIRSRANSVIPAYYDIAKQDAARGARIQGGYGPGQSALFSRMAREQAQGAASTARDTEVGIRDKVNEGRRWGASGMSDAEAALQSMRLSALTGASGLESNMVNSIAQNRTSAAGTGGGNEIGMQGLVQKGKMFGTQGLEGMAESAAARGRAAAADAAADARWQAEFNREGRQFGLEGMRSLYGMRPGEVDMYLGYDLANRELDAMNRQGMYQTRIGNKGKGVDWGKIAAAAGTVALAASDRELKTDIRPVNTDRVIEAFATLPISTWRYKGDVHGTIHLGPMAQDMKEIFGVGDGKTIALVDVMGLLMLLGKALAEKASE